MRVLVVGATGLLGYSLYRAFNALPDVSVCGTYREMPLEGMEALDVTDRPSTKALIQRLRPQAVLFPAANPHVDYCENNPEETRKLNVEATLDAARASHDAGAKFVFFSSDYVFDGARDSYSEGDSPNPVNEYGRQKLDVERALASTPSLVLRVCGVFGWELRPKNFVVRVVDSLEKGRSLAAAHDQVYSPTYAPDLADAVAHLTATKAEGLYHLAGSRAYSRYDWATSVARAFGYEEGLIERVDGDSFKRPEIAPRPAKSVLDCSRVEPLLGRKLLSGQEGLKAMHDSKDEWRQQTGRAARS